MAKTQTNAGSQNESSGKQPGNRGRVRAQPGYRIAVVAFVLTVVLGIGGTAAYAYWNQSTSVAITGSTRSDLPANTTLVTAQPALSNRPATPSWSSCTARLTHKQMENNTFADIIFGWTAAAGATSYVVTVKSTSTAYTFKDLSTGADKQTVSGSAATFRFPRVQSLGESGDPQAGLSPFYTTYSVRVMPMNGTVPGDPLYFMLQYAHRNNNCWAGTDPGSPVPPGFTLPSPVGIAAPVQCGVPVSGPKGEYSDLALTWAGADKATSYSVRVLNEKGYGAETSVATAGASFRIPRISPEMDGEPYFGHYTVRVQPMRGNEAGAPVYKVFQFGKWGQNCWDEAPTYLPPSSSS